MYKTFVLFLLIDQNDIIHDIEAEVHHKITIITKTIIPTQDIVLHLEKDAVMTKIPLLHKTHDHDMTIINEINDLTDHPTCHHTDPLTDAILVLGTDHVHFHATIIFNDTLLHSDHLQDQETLDLLDHGPIPIQEINLTEFNLKHRTQNDPINFEVRMYHPTEMANAVTPTKWFYSLYTHTPSNQAQQDYPSRLEISFLLDSGASLSVLNYPTYVTIAKLLNIKHNNSLTPSKTLTVANQTEVPILDYVTILSN